MYSKYIDYSEAISAHQSSIQQNRHKDVLVSQLKAQTLDLRHLQQDFSRLNSSILSLQDKYSLLLQQKERVQRQSRSKSQQDKCTVISFREDIDHLRVLLQQYNLQIEEYLRQNTNLKRLCEGRGAEIQCILLQVKEAGSKNQRMHDENKNLAIGLKAMKEERKDIEDQCDALSANLDKEIAKLKALEKDIRLTEGTNTKLEKTLSQAEGDHKKLVQGIKSKNQDYKLMESKYKSIKNSLKEAEISRDHIEQNIKKSNKEGERLKGILEGEVKRGKELGEKLTETEIQIKAQQGELDEIILEEEELRRQHFNGLDRNKKLNMEIDAILSLINEYQVVNRELLDEINIMMEQDQQAKEMLSRNDAMRDIIDGAMRKIAITQQPIRHLKG